MEDAVEPTAPVAPAAQYLRMSTEHQRYSIEHQTIVIRTYALARGYEVVRTYSDAGRSGLQIKGRPALSQLLKDVVGGEVDFATILVLDVSRWGRFQDMDEAAHYEFICRSSGVTVQYCAEPFENDGTIYSAIVKQLKRAMAAEYSRELGVKVGATCRGLAARGFRMSGSPGYGLRRLILDEAGYPVGVLQAGERKAVQGHRMMLVPGPREEVETVRRIYRLYVDSGLTMSDIARRLDAEGLRAERDHQWNGRTIRTVLTNEKYIGNNLYGVSSGALGRRPRPTPPEAWIRHEGAFPAIVSRSLFHKAQCLRVDTNVYMNDGAMLEGLLALWREKGTLGAQLIAECRAIPCLKIYNRQFGKLTDIYRIIGYDRGVALKARCPGLSDDEMLNRLSELLGRTRKLDVRIINFAEGLPAAISYAERFGSLANAYKRIGYRPSPSGRSKPRLDTRFHSEVMIAGLKALHQRQGMLSAKLIDLDLALPSYCCCAARFGGIRRLYALIGFPYQPRTITGRIRDAHGCLQPSSTSNEELLRRLGALLDKVGHLDIRLVESTPGLARRATLIRRFGSVERAFKLVDCEPR